MKQIKVNKEDKRAIEMFYGSGPDALNDFYGDISYIMENLRAPVDIAFEIIMDEVKSSMMVY